MAQRSNLRLELEQLRAEFEGLRKAEPQTDSEPEGHMAELNKLVQSMLDGAEDAVNEHPVAAVAGALALGIVIGRLTAR